MKKVNIKSTYRAPVLQQVFLLRLEEDLLAGASALLGSDVVSTGQQTESMNTNSQEWGYD